MKKGFLRNVGLIVVAAQSLYAHQAWSQSDLDELLGPSEPAPNAAAEAAAPADAAPAPAASEAEAPAVAEAAAATAEPAINSPEVAAPASKKPRGSSRVLEEIVVTAQKREEDLMAVPISVTAFSPEALEARGVNSTTDLMKVTPALDYGTQAGDFTSVYIRGIGSEAWLTSDPSVATYVDGVYYPFSPSVAQDLGGIERVEVLKGPQGTLFGRNANGGAINVVVKEPDFEGRLVNLSYGTSVAKGYMQNRTNFFANVPLTDTVAANVSAYFTTDDTYWTKDSTLAGEPFPDTKAASMRLKLRWLAAENVDLRFTVLGSKRDGTATAAAPITRTRLGEVTAALVPGLPGTPGGRDVTADARNYKIKNDLPI